MKTDLKSKFMFLMGAWGRLAGVETVPSGSVQPSSFVIVCFGVIVLRLTQPELKRPFRTPFSPLFPVLGMLSCGALMAFLPALTWLRFFVWLVLGLIVYFVYSIRHSKLG